METRFCFRAHYILRNTLYRSSRACCSGLIKRHDSPPSRKLRHASTQANPIGGFYESLLETPLPSPASDPAAEKLQAASAASSRPEETSSKTQKEEVAAKARVVFGSRLAGPAERRRAKERDSSVIAGIQVPPKPEEPDNCCMSGCVNCVWDVFRDDVEEWAAIRKKADRALIAQLKKGGPTSMLNNGGENAAHTMISMDDDGGGSETNWGSGENEVDDNEELFSGLPIGIREFMKQEKKLKEKHLKEVTSRG